MKENKMSFEDKISILEKLVNDLENDDINLDVSIDKYTKAMKLVKECDKELKSIEEKVTKILKENGEFVPFEVE